MSGSPFKEAFKELESKGFNREVKELKNFLNFVVLMIREKTRF
jgi:hypothetical protein